MVLFRPCFAGQGRFLDLSGLLSRHMTKPPFWRSCSILDRLWMVGMLFSMEAWRKTLSFSRGISGEMDRVPSELVSWCRALEYQEHRGDIVARFGYTGEGSHFPGNIVLFFPWVSTNEQDG